MSETTDRQPARYLTFTLDRQLYALGIRQVTEILPWCHLTDVPLTARYLRGVLNLRGSAVPVMDLASRFGGEPTDAGRRTSIVIVKPSDGGTDPNARPMGIMVDLVHEVVPLATHDIAPAPDLGADVDCSAIIGVARRDGRAIVILDPAIVLAAESLVGAPDLVTLSLAVSRDGPAFGEQPSPGPLFVAGMSELIAGPGIEPVGESVPGFADGEGHGTPGNARVRAVSVG